jgi:hypothetical protein
MKAGGGLGKPLRPCLWRVVVPPRREPEGQDTDPSLEPDGPGLLVVRDGVVLFGATSIPLGRSSLGDLISRLVADRITYFPSKSPRCCASHTHRAAV